MQRIKQLLRKFRTLRISLSHKFVIGVIVTLTITMGVSIYFISKRHRELIMQQVDMQARAIFKQILITRRWIADHGGVFVESLPWKEPNPYLKEAEITDVKGRRFIKESPAMVTKELSKYAQNEGLYWFHITSLKLINPKNAPDEFERKALTLFDKGNIKELSTVEEINHSYLYRYIAPLYVEKACLQCHSHQGYRVGDVRGAISVTIPIDNVLSTFHSERKTIIFTGLTSIGILTLILYVMMKVLVLNPIDQLRASMKKLSKQKKIETGVIRTGDELEELSRSFIEMSNSLNNYQENLKEMVHTATRSLEEANARLTELNMKKSDFITKISHELRTPLTSIKGSMDYLSTRFSMGVKSDNDINDLIVFLDVIKKNADRLIKMVNDTLDLERIESGIFEMHLSHINLTSLIKEIITSFYSVAIEKKTTFKIIAKHDIFIIADEDRIRQVLINLVSNALKVNPANSEILITVTESEKTVTVSIKDEGPGIPAEEHKKIFEKFYTKGIKDGTGLGLSICKGIIEAHGGKIGIANNNGEKGCTFYFTLPHICPK